MWRVVWYAYVPGKRDVLRRTLVDDPPATNEVAEAARHAGGAAAVMRAPGSFSPFAAATALEAGAYTRSHFG